MKTSAFKFLLILGLLCLFAANLSYEVNAQQDIRIETSVIADDEILISGAVEEPQVIKLKADKKITLTQAIAVTGGITKQAVKVAVVTRPSSQTEPGKEIIFVDLRKIKTGKEPDFLLKGGDRVELIKSLTKESQPSPILRDSPLHQYKSPFSLPVKSDKK